MPLVRTSADAIHRRRIIQLASTSLGISLVADRFLASSLLGDEAVDRSPTAAQMLGPYYPIPAISDQKYCDADLTRLADNGPIADGEPIVVEGQILGLDGKPIPNAIVEVWQASAAGRYNHPRDNRSDAPLDPNFQYWAKMNCDAEGRYRFRSIQPGKYPGRTPHIHFRILANEFPELVTQMYFEQFEEFNRRDGIYLDVTPKQAKGLTVGFEKDSEVQALKGTFNIILAKTKDRRATPAS
jgi:protocatechuate 3,4-dioxygenase, beta subunit